VKVLVVILSMVLALAFAGMVCAQTPEKDTAVQKGSLPDKAEITNPVGQASGAPNAAPADKPKVNKMMGSVVSVDAVANTLVVKGKKADETFGVDPAAKIMVAGKEIKLADLTKDTKVVVVYRMDGAKKIALMIREPKAMPAPAAAAAKPEVKKAPKPEAKPEAKTEAKPVAKPPAAKP